MNVLREVLAASLMVAGFGCMWQATADGANGLTYVLLAENYNGYIAVNDTVGFKSTLTGMAHFSCKTKWQCVAG